MQHCHANIFFPSADSHLTNSLTSHFYFLAYLFTQKTLLQVPVNVPGLFYVLCRKDVLLLVLTLKYFIDI